MRKRVAKEHHGTADRQPVIGMKDRKSDRIMAKPLGSTSSWELKGFAREWIQQGTFVFTDAHAGYVGLPRHRSVNHSISQYVFDQVHTNGTESFWATLKRGYHGVYNHTSPKHLYRYVTEYAGRHNERPNDTIDQIKATITGMEGKRLRYRDLAA